MSLKYPPMATHELTWAVALASPPASNRTFAVDEWPFSAAEWRGVVPNCVSIHNILSMRMHNLAALDVPSMSCPSSLLPTLFSQSSNHTMSLRFKIFKLIKTCVCIYLRKCEFTLSYRQNIIASEMCIHLCSCAVAIVGRIFITSSWSSYVNTCYPVTKTILQIKTNAAITTVTNVT